MQVFFNQINLTGKVVLNLGVVEAEDQKINLRCSGISEGSVGATLGN